MMILLGLECFCYVQCARIEENRFDYFYWFTGPPLDGTTLSAINSRLNAVLGKS